MLVYGQGAGFNPIEGSRTSETFGISAHRMPRNPVNLLTLNQARGTDDTQDTTGFYNEFGSVLTLSSSTEEAWEGTRSLKQVWNSGNGGYTGARVGNSYTVPVLPLTGYNFSYMHKGGNGLGFRCWVFDEDGSTVGYKDYTGTNSWQRITVPLATLSTSTYIEPRVYLANSGAGTCYNDGFQLSIGSTERDFELPTGLNVNNKVFHRTVCTDRWKPMPFGHEATDYVKGTVKSPNLLPTNVANGSEDGTVTEWEERGGGGQTVTSNTTDEYSGSHCIQVNNDGGKQGVQLKAGSLVPISPDTNYVFSAQVLNNSANTEYIAIIWYTSGKAEISYVNQSCGTNTVYTKYEVTGKSPSNAAYAGVYSGVNSPGNVVYLDELQLEPGISATSYNAPNAPVSTVFPATLESSGIKQISGTITCTSNVPNALAKATKPVTAQTTVCTSNVPQALAKATKPVSAITPAAHSNVPTALARATKLVSAITPAAHSNVPTALAKATKPVTAQTTACTSNVPNALAKATKPVSAITPAAHSNVPNSAILVNRKVTAQTTTAQSNVPSAVANKYKFVTAQTTTAQSNVPAALAKATKPVSAITPAAHSNIANVNLIKYVHITAQTTAAQSNVPQALLKKIVPVTAQTTTCVSNVPQALAKASKPVSAITPAAHSNVPNVTAIKYRGVTAQTTTAQSNVPAALAKVIKLITATTTIAQSNIPNVASIKYRGVSAQTTTAQSNIPNPILNKSGYVDVSGSIGAHSQVGQPVLYRNIKETTSVTGTTNLPLALSSVSRKVIGSISGVTTSSGTIKLLEKVWVDVVSTTTVNGALLKTTIATGQIDILSSTNKPILITIGQVDLSGTITAHSRVGMRIVTLAEHLEFEIKAPYIKYEINTPHITWNVTSGKIRYIIK